MALEQETLERHILFVASRRVGHGMDTGIIPSRDVQTAQSHTAILLIRLHLLPTYLRFY